MCALYGLLRLAHGILVSLKPCIIAHLESIKRCIAIWIETGSGLNCGSGKMAYDDKGGGGCAQAPHLR